MPARYFNAEPRSYSPSRPLASSSEDENGQLDVEEEFEARLPGSSNREETFVPRQEVNAFQTTSEELTGLSLQHTSAGVILIMPIGTCFSFVGVCYITVLRGIISLSGVRLHASPHSHPLFSPKSNPLALIKAFENLSEEYPIALPTRISKSTGHTSIVLLQQLRTGVESLGNYRIFSQLFHIDDDERSVLSDQAIGIEGMYFVDPFASPKRQMQPFTLPDSWSTALDSSIPVASPDDAFSLPKPFIGLVKGLKNSGKSTFSRTLLNTLLNRYIRVAFLECDIGQSEFTPGGMVSLHVISTPIFGPPFTHPTIPYRAHYIGSSTPRSTPTHYIAAIQELIDTYRSEIQNSYEMPLDGDNRLGSVVPLVINTQGWIKGLGADLLQRIEDLASPTAIYCMDAEGVFSGYTQPLTQAYQIQSFLSSPLTQYFAAADHRTFAILSYFHSLFMANGNNAEVSRWNTDLPLYSHRPWEVSLKEGIDKIILTGAGAEDVLPDQLHLATNCALVGLVCDNNSFAEASESCYIQGHELPCPSHSRCVGLGLIRGIDLGKDKLHLLTPLPSTILRDCRILVKGELEMPVWGMIDFRDGHDNGIAGIGWGKVPYLQMGHGDAGVNVIGGTKRRVRRNLMRKNQGLI